MNATARMVAPKGTYKVELLEGKLNATQQRALLDDFCDRFDTLRGAAIGESYPLLRCGLPGSASWKVVEVEAGHEKSRTPIYIVEVIPRREKREKFDQQPSSDSPNTEPEPDWQVGFLAAFSRIVDDCQRDSVERRAFDEIVPEISAIVKHRPDEFAQLVGLACLGVRRESLSDQLSNRRRKALLELLIIHLHRRLKDAASDPFQATETNRSQGMLGQLYRQLFS